MACPKAAPTTERVRKLLDYDPQTGAFRWRNPQSNRVRKGAIAGKIGNRGYLRLGIDGGRYQAHRLAWLWHYGQWPHGDVDHINGQRDDNRIANLRIATRSQNLWNSRRQSRNTSGFKGVSFDKNRRQWQAHICVTGHVIHLGRFSSPEAAHDAYISAATRYFGEFARAA
jgi:hypothetical protein